MTLRLRYRWKLVALLFVAGTLNYADRTAISAVFPLLRDDLQLSDMALGTVGTLFLWAYALGSPAAGYLADRMSRSRLVVGSLAAWSLIMVLTGLAWNLPALLVLRVLLGLAECAYLPAAVALVADFHDAGTRATAISLHSQGLGFGPVLGASAAGFLGDRFGWRSGFFALGGAGLLLALAMRRRLLDRAVPDPSALPVRSKGAFVRNLRAVLRIPSCWILLLQGMAISAAIWMFLNWLPLYFNETFGMSLAAAGFAATFLPKIATTAGSLGGAVLSDRMARTQGERRMLLQSGAYLCAAPFLLVFLGDTPFWPLAGGIACFYLFRSLGSVNDTPLVCDLLPPRQRSTALGLYNMVNTLAGGVGILAAGFGKRHFGLAGVFAGVSALIAAAGVLTLAGYVWFLRRDLASASRAEQ